MSSTVSTAFGCYKPIPLDLLDPGRFAARVTLSGPWWLINPGYQIVLHFSPVPVPCGSSRQAGSSDWRTNTLEGPANVGPALSCWFSPCSQTLHHAGAPTSHVDSWGPISPISGTPGRCRSSHLLYELDLAEEKSKYPHRGQVVRPGQKKNRTPFFTFLGLRHPQNYPTLLSEVNNTLGMECLPCTSKPRMHIGNERRFIKVCNFK